MLRKLQFCTLLEMYIVRMQLSALDHDLHQREDMYRNDVNSSFFGFIILVQQSSAGVRYHRVWRMESKVWDVISV